MTDPSLPVAPARTGIPGQRQPADHARRPDLAEPAWTEPRPVAPRPVDEPYAHWWRRVVAALIDTVLVVPFWVVAVIGSAILIDGTTFYNDGTGGPFGIGITDFDATTSTWVGGGIIVGAYLSLFVFSIWNRVFRQGRLGASIGKACLCLMVVDDQTGRPIGALATFVRSAAHVLDAVVFCLGFLWPLVDRRRQTFADKVMRSVVLHLPPQRATPAAQAPVGSSTPYGW